MTRILDWYLIGRPAAGGHGNPNPFQERHLRCRLALDGYLMETLFLTGREPRTHRGPRASHRLEQVFLLDRGRPPAEVRRGGTARAVIVPADPAAAPKLMRCLPFWTAPRPDPREVA